MTLSGTKVEGFVRADADLENIVIGQIEKIEAHPDADKLIICQVNVGTETTQIVTGAPNVKVGDKVPVVLDGGRVAGGHDGKPTPGGIAIKKGKLRGVESNGMMCSIEFYKRILPRCSGVRHLYFPRGCQGGRERHQSSGTG